MGTDTPVDPALRPFAQPETEVERKPKLLWVSDAPWTPGLFGLQTNYATAMLAPSFDIAYLALNTQMTLNPTWLGRTVYGNPMGPDGANALRIAGAHFQPDVVLFLGHAHEMPLHAAPEEALRILWSPVDHSPIPTDILMAMPGADMIIVPSIRTLEELQQHLAHRPYGNPPSYVPYVVPKAFFEPQDQAAARGRLGIEPEAFVFLMVGRNEGFPPRKGFEEAMRAFRRVQDGYPAAKPRLLLVTEATPPWPGLDLRQLGARLDIMSEVHTPHDLDRWVTLSAHGALRTYYAAADVFLDASYGTGFAVRIAEAMACGLPIIAPTHTGMLDRPDEGYDVETILTQRERGHQFAPDVDSLTQLMGEMIGETVEQRAQYGAASRQWAIEHYAEQPVAMWWQRVLDDVKQRLAERAE